MNILITGGAGFIGSNLSKKLIELGNKVIIIDNFNSYYNPKFKRENIKDLLKNKNFAFYEGDIVDTDFLHPIFKKNSFDKIIHLAASVGVRNSLRYPEIYKKNNINGTQNMLDMASIYGIKHFLFASSSSIYGNNSPMPFKENKVADSQLSPYAQTKKIGELLCFKYHQKFNTRITIFRFFTVYGPNGRPDMAPYIFTESILKGKLIHIYGDGSAKRDFTYIQDLISGILAGVEKPFPYEVFNLADSSPIDLIKFIQTIEKVTGEKAKIKFGEIYLPEMRNTYANIQKAEKLLNYKPRIGIEEGLRVFVKWFKENRLI